MVRHPIGRGAPCLQGQDDLRDAEISYHGYEVVSLKPESPGYYEEVKKLVEQIELDMSQAETDRWKVAIEVESEKY
jgi:hypothetical protein